MSENPELEYDWKLSTCGSYFMDGEGLFVSLKVVLARLDAVRAERDKYQAAYLRQKNVCNQVDVMLDRADKERECLRAERDEALARISCLTVQDSASAQDLMAQDILRLRAERDEWKRLYEGDVKCAEGGVLDPEDCDQVLRVECDRLRAEVADWRETQRSVIEEKCPTDEVHCTCVPMLRKELAELRHANQLVGGERDELARCYEEKRVELDELRDILEHMRDADVMQARADIERERRGHD